MGLNVMAVFHVLGCQPLGRPEESTKHRSRIARLSRFARPSWCLLRQANGELGRLLSGVSIRNAVSLSLAVIKLRWNSLKRTGGPKHLSLGGHFARYLYVSPARASTQ